MNNPEIHLFIIWQRGRYKETEIMEDMARHFTMLKQYAITWTPELVSSNFTRFYGVNLPPKSGKERHCGTGEFLLCIVKDENPVYAERMTSRGPEVVNTNMFDAKARYRSWTGGGHKIHGTNSERETNHDLTLLVGKNVEDFLKDNKEAQRETLQKDIEGARGWESLRHLFYVLNNTISYVVLRNFESLPDKHDVSIHGDIDLLAENKENMRYITNAKPVYSEPYRVYHKVTIGEQVIPFDFRYVGDNYYDRTWEEDILDGRGLNSHGFYVMDATNQYYSLLYHAYIQKRYIASDYPDKLSRFAKAVGIECPSTTRECIGQLDMFITQNNYEYIRPIDASVVFNVEHLLLSERYMRYGGVCIKAVRLSMKDLITDEKRIWKSKVFRKVNTYVKAGTPWIIDNEARFLQIVGDGVRFPRLIASGKDGDEHWFEQSAMPGRQIFNNRWSIRLSNIRSYAMQCLALLEMLYNNNIIHRDIQHENIIVSAEGNLSIIDFAFAVDFRNDKEYFMPRLSKFVSPEEGYSDFYNMAGIFENRFGSMPFVQKFVGELKKIDWSHYPDVDFVTKQISLARISMQQSYSIQDICEFIVSKYRLRKYLDNPQHLWKLSKPLIHRGLSYLWKLPKKLYRKLMKIFK